MPNEMCRYGFSSASIVGSQMFFLGIMHSEKIHWERERGRSKRRERSKRVSCIFSLVRVRSSLAASTPPTNPLTPRTSCRRVLHRCTASSFLLQPEHEKKTLTQYAEDFAIISYCGGKPMQKCGLSSLYPQWNVRVFAFNTAT